MTIARTMKLGLGLAVSNAVFDVVAVLHWSTVRNMLAVMSLLGMGALTAVFLLVGIVEQRAGSAVSKWREERRAERRRET